MLFISVAATSHCSCFHLQCSLFLLVSLVDDVICVSVVPADAALVSVAPVDVSPADAAFAAAFFVLLGIASFSTCVVCNVCNSQCRRMPDGALVHLPVGSTPHPCSKVRLHSNTKIACNRKPRIDLDSFSTPVSILSRMHSGLSFQTPISEKNPS